MVNKVKIGIWLKKWLDIRENNHIFMFILLLKNLYEYFNTYIIKLYF